MTRTNPARLRFRKSSYSTSGGGQCVEVASKGASFAIRDSKDKNGPVLEFDTTDIQAFVADIKVGRL